MSQNCEVEVLKDQVNKLTEFLAQYQKAFPNFKLQETAFYSEKGNDMAMLSNNPTHPLLKEYNAQQEHITFLENELERLKREAKTLVQANERLHQDLKEVIQAGLSNDLSAGGGDGEDIRVLQNLQQQLDLAIQEKDAAQEKWREAVAEVDRMEAALEIEKENHQWRVVEQQANQVKAQYQESMISLSGELELLHTELRESRGENSELMQKVSEMKLTISNLQQHLIWKSQETADVLLKEGMNDSRVYELQKIMDDLRDRLSSISHEAEELRKENNILSTKVGHLQNKLNDSELQENEAILQVKNAVQMAEAAVVEKDQCKILAKQKEEELEEMKSVLSKVIDKAGERTREEVDNVRKQCNDRITQLTEELHALEMDGAEKQSNLDRLLREKRAVESELQKLLKEYESDGSKFKESHLQLNKRAIDAERARDEAIMKVDSLQSQVDKLLLDNKELKQQMHSESKLLQERLTQLQSEFEVINGDRMDSLNKLNELNKKLLSANQEKDFAHRKFSKELALMEQDQQMKTRELEIKIQTIEDVRQQSVSELRKLLTAQQRMSARWKEECQTLTHKFESKLEDIRNEITHVKRHNEELTSLLKDSQFKTAEAQRLLSDYTKHIRRMEERVREAEIQAGDKAKQLAYQSRKEKQHMTERAISSQLAQSQRANTVVSQRDEVL